MNNYCKRNCHWQYKGQCLPETDSHDNDGTVYTKNCTQFLHVDYFKKMDNVLTECQLLPMQLSYSQLRKARHALKQILKDKKIYPKQRKNKRRIRNE